MTLFFIFLKQEIFFAGKNAGKFLQNILFFLICCFVFLMLAQSLPNLENKEFFVQLIIWFSLLFATFFASAEIFASDFRDGTIEQMIIFCENFEVYIAAKILASWIVFVLPIILISPLIMILFGLEASKISSLFWVLVFASLSINFISALCASFNVAENKAALLTILALPLLIPVLLLSFDQNAKLLCALAVFCSVVSVFAASAIVKIAAE